ncbi:hypothetical protein KFL_002170060 [Klebsormidium nitens]|uniref:Transmembrane protein n=1 Tax=Klebsormidium nitens TaxID=105231 RepID=A0A1Y1I4Y1_KLENI|nr:hypothetical protein KFL_002170060 [Klebsormidium nitens]|eukprot:GAQ85012.1 hypothetical protein KFL_002170060 [Klebsormidium nitens]
MADMMDRPRLSGTSPGPGDAPMSANENYLRSSGDIIKEYLGERNLFPDAPGGSGGEPPSEAQKADANSKRSDPDLIREYLGERRILSNLCQDSPEDSLRRAEKEQQTTERAEAAAPVRQPFSDSSWLDKFLDERDKELDLVLEASDNEDEFAVSLEGSWVAHDSSKPALVPKSHLIARPTSIAAEELVARHKRSLEVHCGVDYNDWTSVALQPAKSDRKVEADENVGRAAPGGALLVEEILTDDFDSSSACSSDDSEETCAKPTSWALYGSFEGITGARGPRQVSDCGGSQKDPGRLERMPHFSSEQSLNPSAGLKVQRTLERAVVPEERAEVSHLLSRPDVFGLMRSPSADRELYSEVVRATERGASQERERMDAVLSATVAANRTGATRMSWSLAFANPQLEETYRRSHIASGGDADYLCAVLRIWFSVLHLYMLARQFSILKEIRWGWIAITAPGRPLLSTSLEWNIAGLVLMSAFLYMHLCQRSWWNKNRLALLSVYLTTVWALEVWYTLASQDAPGYRLVRLGSPAFFMTFMYNVPFVLHMRFRVLLLLAQLAALAARQDAALCPWIVLFHVLSSAVAYLLDRRSRLAFVKNLPPCLLNWWGDDRGSFVGGSSSTSWMGRESRGSDAQSKGESYGLGGRARRVPGGIFAEEGQRGVRLAGSLGGEGGESSGFEDQLRERLRQRRPSLGGFAGGFAGVGCVKSGHVAYGTRLAHAGLSKDSQGEQVA